VANGFGPVVEFFNSAIINPALEVFENALLMTPDHPGELSDGF
jgi:hypothetical protein